MVAGMSNLATQRHNVGNLLRDAARRHAKLLLLLRIATGRNAEPS